MRSHSRSSPRSVRKSAGHSVAASRWARPPLRLERLEDRLAPAVVTWDGGAGMFD